MCAGVVTWMNVKVRRAFSINGSPAVADYLVLATANPRPRLRRASPHVRLDLQTTVAFNFEILNVKAIVSNCLDREC
jgi:hypothetical protein